MSSSGLIYAVIVGAWAAYLVPMWLRRQDELNEARPTERFSTAIRLLSGRAGMERRYAKDLKARTDDPFEPPLSPGDVTDSVDVRAFAMPPTQPRESAPAENRYEEAPADVTGADERARADEEPREPESPRRPKADRDSRPARDRAPSRGSGDARARRTQVLARRRRTTVLLFLAFTAGAVVAGVGGLAYLWAPLAPAALLSVYIVHLRRQERRRYAYVMDRRRAEEAARRLRERQAARRGAQEGRRAGELPSGAGELEDPGRSALAAGRRALVEQTDHAEWVDQQREPRRGPARGDSWDPVPVPLPTYVTAPVAPRATGSIDIGAPDTWSAARSSAAEPGAARTADRARTRPEGAGRPADGTSPAADGADRTADGGNGVDATGERSDARRAASARRARERGRTPLFDQYDDGDRPRAANE